MKIFDRIAASVAPKAKPQSSAEIAGLLADAQSAASEASDRARDTRERAFDLALSPAEATALHATGQAEAFAAARLDVAATRLSEMLAERQADEAEAGRQARYDAALKRRDEVAARIHAEFPKLQASLVALIRATIGAGIEVDEANRDLPAGAAVLDKPEGHARGFRDRLSKEGEFRRGLLRITQMAVPEFTDPERCAWPPGMFANAAKGGQPHWPRSLVAIESEYRADWA